jgi:hypothetical protein
MGNSSSNSLVAEGSGAGTGGSVSGAIAGVSFLSGLDATAEEPDEAFLGSGADSLLWD